MKIDFHAKLLESVLKQLLVVRNENVFNRDTHGLNNCPCELPLATSNNITIDSAPPEIKLSNGNQKAENKFQSVLFLYNLFQKNNFLCYYLCRYIMLRGSSGFYSYAIFERSEGMPEVNIYQARIAFKLQENK